MVSERQQLINNLFFNGIGLTGGTIDRVVKKYNEFSMPIKDRIKYYNENLDEFIKNLQAEELI